MAHPDHQQHEQEVYHEEENVDSSNVEHLVLDSSSEHHETTVESGEESIMADTDHQETYSHDVVEHEQSQQVVEQEGSNVMIVDEEEISAEESESTAEEVKLKVDTEDATQVVEGVGEGSTQEQETQLIGVEESQIADDGEESQHKQGIEGVQEEAH